MRLDIAHDRTAPLGADPSDEINGVDVLVPDKPEELDDPVSEPAESADDG